VYKRQGRRFGKSAICAYIALKTILEADMAGKPVKIWIVAPTYDLADKVFEYLARWFMRVCPSQAKGVSFRVPQVLKTAKGSFTKGKSADSPNALLGEGLHLLIIDECSRIQRDVYDTYLYPTTTSEKNCRRFFISTPFGKNWFWEKWKIANEEGGAFHFTTRDNPTLPDVDKIMEDAKRTLPADIYSQEFLAQFKEGAGTVFRNVDNCISQDLDGKTPPVVGHRYYMGLDLAKMRDFTVITIIDKSSHDLVYFDRFQKVPYTLIKDRVRIAAKKYNNPKIIIDSINVGGSVADELRAMGLNIKEFKSEGTISKDWKKRGTKTQLIEKLAMLLEEHSINLPYIPTLIEELKSFSYVLSESGNMKYSAPTGLHDDCVDSLALAVWMLHGKIKQKNILLKRSITSNNKNKFEYE